MSVLLLQFSTSSREGLHYGEKGSQRSTQGSHSAMSQSLTISGTRFHVFEMLAVSQMMSYCGSNCQKAGYDRKVHQILLCMGLHRRRLVRLPTLSLFTAVRSSIRHRYPNWIKKGWNKVACLMNHAFFTSRGCKGVCLECSCRIPSTETSCRAV